MIITNYHIDAPVYLKAAVVADLHGKPTPELYRALEKERPDVILLPGDLATVGEYENASPEWRERRKLTQEKGIEFLREAVNIAPVYYSLGNHEWGVEDEYRAAVKSTGAVLLENEWARFGDIWIGGQNSAQCGVVGHIKNENIPDTEWLRNSPDGYKILLCHHPEYYPLIYPYADLIVAGHTHGAQWRLFGHGIFAPNQGWFPKYSKGKYDKMIVSAGLTNTTWVPRINNPCELVIVECGSIDGRTEAE